MAATNCVPTADFELLSKIPSPSFRRQPSKTALPHVTWYGSTKRFHKYDDESDTARLLSMVANIKKTALPVAHPDESVASAAGQIQSAGFAKISRSKKGATSEFDSQSSTCCKAERRSQVEANRGCVSFTEWPLRHDSGRTSREHHAVNQSSRAFLPPCEFAGYKSVWKRTQQEFDKPNDKQRRCSEFLQLVFRDIAVTDERRSLHERLMEVPAYFMTDIAKRAVAVVWIPQEVLNCSSNVVATSESLVSSRSAVRCVHAYAANK